MKVLVKRNAELSGHGPSDFKAKSATSLTMSQWKQKKPKWKLQLKEIDTSAFSKKVRRRRSSNSKNWFVNEDNKWINKWWLKLYNISTKIEQCIEISNPKLPQWWRSSSQLTWKPSCSISYCKVLFKWRRWWRRQDSCYWTSPNCSWRRLYKSNLSFCKLPPKSRRS